MKFSIPSQYFRSMNAPEPIPFSPPRIDERTIAAVTEVLQSGWITTGPRTADLERGISALTGGCEVLCLNSWTNACELVLRWFGVGPGDEVIVPAYTYAATANIVMHVGARPVMVDVQDDVPLVAAASIAAAMTEKTKVVMPVDIGGIPVDYDAIRAVLEAKRSLFRPNSPAQEELGRVLFLADAAHSFGARYKGDFVGAQADVTGYSFHAVKNLTTAEGGALVFNLPEPFDNAEVRAALRRSSLHGQTKDALSKTVTGGWRYDIVEAGYKCNMTDLHAAIGCVELDRYDETLAARKAVCDFYDLAFGGDTRFKIQSEQVLDYDYQTAWHLYMLRIEGANEHERDAVIDALKAEGIATNVHFQPLPLLSFYKQEGYRMEDYPKAFAFYENEISLPVWYGMRADQLERVVQGIRTACAK